MGMFWCAFYGRRAAVPSSKFPRKSSRSFSTHWSRRGHFVPQGRESRPRLCNSSRASARKNGPKRAVFILDLLCKSDAKRKRKFKGISVLFTPTLFARARNGARSAASPPRPPVSPRVVRPVTPRPVAPPGAALSAGPRVPGAASAWAPTGRSLSIAHTQKHTRPPPAAAGSKDGRCGP